MRTTHVRRKVCALRRPPGPASRGTALRRYLQTPPSLVLSLPSPGTAEGRASRAESLLRKVDERKAAAEVERRKASEAAARMEQQVRGNRVEQRAVYWAIYLHALPQPELP